MPPAVRASIRGVAADGAPISGPGHPSRIVYLRLLPSLRALSFCWSCAIVCSSLGATKVWPAPSSLWRFDQLPFGTTELLGSSNGADSRSGPRTGAGSGEHSSPGAGVVFQHGLGSILA